MKNLFGGHYRNKTVLLTGHTGFKGSWLAYWLQQLGATVIGYSLPAPTQPNHWQFLNLSIEEHIGDIRAYEPVLKVIQTTQPDLIIHMAAQALVRFSYQQPLDTLQTNIMGTAILLEAARQWPSLKGVIVVTSDKCYENPETGEPLTETAPMGGYDPYSMSKGAAELVTNSYRNSFFSPKQYGQKHQTLLASVRAGNVIGGGDWAPDRLIPDLIRGSLANRPAHIRNPDAIRPWQHVLEPLSGYLLVGQQLLQGHVSAGTGWNFGPLLHDSQTVKAIISQAQHQWPAIAYTEANANEQPHEAQLLRLDCSKAQQQLNWRPVWETEQAVARTIDWYRAYYESGKIRTHEDVDAYIKQAQHQNCCWTQ